MSNPRGLSETCVSKEALLIKLNENRDAHQAAYTEAMKAYRVKFREAVERLNNALNADALTDWKEVEKRFQALTNLPKPFESLSEYDNLIAKIGASIDDSFVLTSHEFNCYWLDQWSWKSAFETTNSSYVR